jgi:hypothetical protein
MSWGIATVIIYGVMSFHTESEDAETEISF